MSNPRPSPSDQAERDRFISEIGRNFSVIAPAGVGKTESLTRRIVALALQTDHARALEWLPQLVVVTYTKRAADEMQHRVRNALLEKSTDGEILAAFNRAFFGTIHSFCVKLLSQHGAVLGVPTSFEVLSRDTDLWRDFIQTLTGWQPPISTADWERLLAYVPIQTVLEMGRNFEPHRIAPVPFDGQPQADIEPILAFEATGNGKKNIELAKDLARHWVACEAQKNHLPLPGMPGTNKKLEAVWYPAFQEYRDWIALRLHTVARSLWEDFRKFRLERGRLTFDDQVQLASELFSHPETARKIRRKKYRVILDEAQDTDPLQFEVLLEMTRPPGATGRWLAQRDGEGPEPGRFCMVGDPQQSIYGQRADLSRYRFVDDKMVEADSGARVCFSVTFRCDQAVIDCVNEMFPRILNTQDNDVAFVPLQPRPGVWSGQVVRVPLDFPQDLRRRVEAGEKVTHSQKYEAQARAMAAWIRTTGLTGLRATRWSQVAILCPRKKWFAPYVRALRREGIDCQVQSESEIRGQSPAYAWMCALLMVMADPGNSFELTGVLREIFGISDEALAHFAEGNGGRFDITNPQPTPPGNEVAAVLDGLAGLRRRILRQPLREAVETLAGSVRLRERLARLPDGDGPGRDGETERLITLAGMAGARGKTLAEFAEQLRDGFFQTADTRRVQADAIQLITAQKAKGLQWEAVIVPFLWRGIRNVVNSEYPFLVPGVGPSGECLVLADSADNTPAVDALRKMRARREMQRLAYVAVTRARHTLVFVDDRAMGEKKGGAAPEDSWAAYLKCAGTEKVPGANEEAFLRLTTGEEGESRIQIPDSKGEKNEDSRFQVPDSKGERNEDSGFQIPDSKGESDELDLQEVREVSGQFVRKVSPHTLAVHSVPTREEPEVRAQFEEDWPYPAEENPGTQYGSWWHEFVEELDWQGNPAKWSEIFERQLVLSPDAARSRREWELLRTHLAGPTGLQTWLCGPGNVVHAELPFFWKVDDGRVVEGIMDMAVFDPARGRWLILDWKTNRAASGEGLREEYRGQIAAYVQALAEMTGLAVEAGLYATHLGQWIPYAEGDISPQTCRG
ncbi:MAG: UvrD-helicase domain-containing protein [Verrucomicrobiae bacterium]|nr:UvrD-helicase domain-containing protein [Verrucomicrobiae bacterium]